MELAEFIEAIKEEFEQEEQANVKAGAVFRDLESWNSMMALIIIAKIDSTYNVSISADELAEAKTFQDLFELTQNKAAQ
jgi:acyl carrier protein